MSFAVNVIAAPLIPMKGGTKIAPHVLESPLKYTFNKIQSNGRQFW